MAKRAAKTPDAGPVKLKGLSLKAIHRELRRRQWHVDALTRRRDRVLAKIARLDASIRELGGPASGGVSGRGRRGRGKAGAGLAQSLQAVLKDKTMGVNEAADAVRKAGYQSNAANFRTMVNATLLKHKKLFKRVSRGQYTAA